MPFSVGESINMINTYIQLYLSDISPWARIILTSKTSSSCRAVHDHPRKHKTLTHCWVNVGPASATLAQHWPNNASMSYAAITRCRQIKKITCQFSLKSFFFAFLVRGTQCACRVQQNTRVVFKEEAGASPPPPSSLDVTSLPGSGYLLLKLL